MTDSDWIPVETGIPVKNRNIEMKDASGRVLTGYHDGSMWRFIHWGSGEPIEYWRYLPVDNCQQ